MSLNKTIISLIASILIATSSFAADECFENTSRAMFNFNMGFDKAILKPIAKGYNKLPEPIRKGTGNFTSNIGTLLSIPNHILQGQFSNAANATGSFVINSDSLFRFSTLFSFLERSHEKTKMNKQKINIRLAIIQK